MATNTDLIAELSTAADLCALNGLENAAKMLLERASGVVPRLIEPTNLDPRFAQTEFVVEADGFATLALWRENHMELDWQQDPMGIWLQVGELAGLPVAISCSWSRIGGRLVMFWEPTSMVFHHQLVEDWFDRYCSPRTADGRPARTNAMNFHNFRRHILDNPPPEPPHD